jgi:dihydroneopterin aldolase
VIADRIELRAIRVVGTHGVLAHEREQPQPFEVDLDVELDLRAAAEHDDLGRTVDYGALVAEVVAIIEGPSRRLLESVAGAIADAVLAHAGVSGVTVALRKLRPPVAADMASAGVRIARLAPPAPIVAIRAAPPAGQT